MALSRDPKARSRQLANRRNAPPPERGNRRAVKHGARARPDPARQATIEAQLRDSLPVRGLSGEAPAHDAVAISLLAITLVRIETVAAYTSQHGMFLAGGKPRPSVEVEDRLISRASTLADKLGMSPTSRAKLGLDLAHAEVSLAQLMSDAGDTPRRRTRPRPDDIEGTATDD